MIDLVTLLVGGGSGILGLVGGAVGGAVGREARFNTRVDQELRDLRFKVGKCEAERTEFAVVKMGARMAFNELSRIEPENPVLLAVAAAFTLLPDDDQDMAALLRRLHQEDNDEPDAAEG